MQDLPLIAKAHQHAGAIALESDSGQCTYNDLLQRSSEIACQLLQDREDLQEARVAYLIPTGFDYVAVQWGIWRAGGVAVPLSLAAAPTELEYALVDSQATQVVTTGQLLNKFAACHSPSISTLVIDAPANEAIPCDLPTVATNRRAMILYTSGTTSRPKGVVSTHANIESQITSLVRAWQWQSSDCIPLFLPLHHIHGIINVLSCALWVGAKVETLDHFEINTVLRRVADQAFTIFMAVPTIYVKLITAIETVSANELEPIIAGFTKMRLMVSGSAALPATVHVRWSELTGQQLLERYGMTEIGMALSNPYHGDRLPGTVGQPLPKVQIRLKTEQGEVVSAEGQSGEIQVRGPAVFLEYWNRPEVTPSCFDQGWFRTGDIAVCEGGYYRIMGRQSVDIIKSGGYKLSALEIETVLLDHPAIAECAVVGVVDKTWGEAVAAAVVCRHGQGLDLDSLRHWSAERLSKYKIPKQLLIVESLPRNAMGKVTKPVVARLF